MQPTETPSIDRGAIKITLLGPSLLAVSGVATHLSQLIHSRLATRFVLDHFQVGSEGRTETVLGKALRMAISPFSLAYHVFKNRSSIVHLNTSLEPSSYWRDIVYLLVAKALRKKVVYQVHGGALPEEFFAGHPWLKEGLRWVLAQPDVVVLLASCELSAYRRFAPRARLTVIANAVDTLNLGQERLFRPPHEPLRLVYVGRLVETKGIFDVVEAVRILRDRGVRTSLLIAGTGPAEQDLRKLVREANLGDRVRFMGAVFGDAKDRLWLEADIFAFPTFHREGLPYAILECMASGAVPVATPVGAIPDVMENEVQGLFVPPHDPTAVAAAIERLDINRDQLQRMALRGRQRIGERYTIARMADDFFRLYEEL